MRGLQGRLHLAGPPECHVPLCSWAGVHRSHTPSCFLLGAPTHGHWPQLEDVGMGGTGVWDGGPGWG